MGKREERLYSKLCAGFFTKCEKFAQSHIRKCEIQVPSLILKAKRGGKLSSARFRLLYFFLSIRRVAMATAKMTAIAAPTIAKV